MDEFYYSRNHIPAFGSWEYDGDLQFTECFEKAREHSVFRYGYSDDRDLYVTGDLYENDVVTPAVIVVPRRTVKQVEYGKEKGGKEEEDDDLSFFKLPSSAPPPHPKAVDEDLYKISPHLLRRASYKRKGLWGFFTSCMKPSCVC